MIVKRRDEMFDYIKGWENSSLSQLDFCKKNHINIGTFGYWRTQYLRKDSLDNTVKVFKPIKLLPKIETNYKITYPNGVCISMSSGIDINELAKLIRCLD